MTTTEQAKYTEEVQLALIRRKLSITDFARMLRGPRGRRHRNTISQAIHHPGYYPKVAAQIKKKLGITV